MSKKKKTSKGNPAKVSDSEQFLETLNRILPKDQPEFKGSYKAINQYDEMQQRIGKYFSHPGK